MGVVIPTPPNPKAATTVLGLDPSIRHTGIARWRDGVLSTMTVHTDPNAPIESRMRWICGQIWPLITTKTFVVLEAPYVTANGKTTMMLAGLHYVLRYGLYARNVPFGVITPAGLKTFACGDGTASKQEMIAVAMAMYGDLTMGHWKLPVPVNPNDEANSHEADALHCLTTGLHHVGVSVAPGGAMEPGIDSDQFAYLKQATVEWPQMEWQ
jgi:Holliday junction resolvasome RuvABC endonuclease subunit